MALLAVPYKIWGILVALFLALSFMAFPLGYGLTTTRIAIVLFLLLAASQLNEFKLMPKVVYITFVASAIGSFAYFLSFSANNEIAPPSEYLYEITEMQSKKLFGDQGTQNLVKTPSTVSIGYLTNISKRKENAATNFNGEKTAGLIKGDGYFRYVNADTRKGKQYITIWVVKAGTDTIISFGWAGNHSGNRTSFDLNLLDGSVQNTKEAQNEIFGSTDLGKGWWAVYYSSTLESGSRFRPQIVKGSGSLYFGGIQIVGIDKSNAIADKPNDLPSNRASSIWMALSFLLLGLLSCLIAYCAKLMNPIHNKQFFWLITIIVISTWTFLITQAFIENSAMESGFSMRRFVASMSPVRLNRFMNMMVVISGIIAGMLTFNIKKKSAVTYFALLAIVLTVYFSIVTGSRQSILALAALIIIFAFIQQKSALKAMISASIVFSLAAFVFLVLNQVGLMDISFIQQRLINPITSDAPPAAIARRIVEMNIAWDAALQGGFGPGNFYYYTGTYPHNGYLYFLAEAGLIKGGIALLAIWGIIIYTFIKLRQKHDLSPLARSAWVVFLVLATVMNMFNDLFREPIFWATLGLAVGASAASPLKVPEPKEEAEPVH